MSSEYTEPDPEFTVLEERLQFRSEKKRQKDTARLIWASKPRREPSPKDLEFQTAEEVYPNKATDNLKSFFNSGENFNFSHEVKIGEPREWQYILISQDIV